MIVITCDICDDKIDQIDVVHLEGNTREFGIREMCPDCYVLYKEIYKKIVEEQDAKIRAALKDRIIKMKREAKDGDNN